MYAELLVYTRKPKDEYTDSLSNSIHFALRQPPGGFEPLNLNYGILFAEATIASDNTICEKGLKNPYVFRMKDGLYGITAVRTGQKNADDEESKDRVLLWTTTDFIDFTCRGLTEPNNALLADTDMHGNNHDTEVSIPDINPGNTIQIEQTLASAMYNYWTAPHHIETKIPDRVTVSTCEELENITAAAVYSDGSTARKRVQWDLSGVDFSAAGEYTIKGKAVTLVYPFPLARGYADPVILPRGGKYYFLATNDNKGDICLYARGADTINALFAEDIEEKVILGVDEEKGFIQTFWAPEFHEIGGELYILFAVGGEQWGPQCHMMKLKNGGDIMNPEDWSTPVRVKRKDGSFLTEKGITLDMTYFRAAGKSYVCWSERYAIGSAQDSGSMLYIAEANERAPEVLASEPVLLTRPLYGWENVQGTINNEGPYPLITDDTVYITYSGGAARGYTYSIGLMSAPVGSDLLDIKSWKKAVTPVVNYLSINGRYGAGHNSFFYDTDGNLMIAYHAEEEITGHGTACSALHRVHFRQDGTPLFNMNAEQDLDETLSEVSMTITICPPLIKR